MKKQVLTKDVIEATKQVPQLLKKNGQIKMSKAGNLYAVFNIEDSPQYASYFFDLEDAKIEFNKRTKAA